MHRPPQRLRVPSPGWRPLAAVAVVLAMAAGGWLVVRDSSLAKVQRVYITGLSSPDEPRIRRALQRAALGMSTLDVREEALAAAVRDYPSVTRVSADADFPHELTLTVHERRAVAMLDVPGQAVPVAPGGALLAGMRTDPGLPVVTARRGARDRRVAAAVAVLAAAPASMHRRARRAWHDRRGLVVDLRQGPTLVFGSRDRPRAKWAAAARVLAEPGVKGAVYLDLRVPERVAAGGVATSMLDLDSTVSPAASPLAQVQPD